MANYKWPNVYPTIKDLSGVVATNSVTSCAYVGEAEFGPINQPTFLSTLKDYTNIFGALNSAKYGYAGYSLAVASESINSHYFVRVVQAGNPEDKEEDRKTNAKYSSVSILKKDDDNDSAKSETKGWYVEEIKSVVDKEDASGLFGDDKDHALMFVASDPNNLKVAVRLTDSTINENRAYAFSSLTYAPSNDLVDNHFLATVSGVDTRVMEDLKEGECIEPPELMPEGWLPLLDYHEIPYNYIEWQVDAHVANELKYEIKSINHHKHDENVLPPLYIDTRINNKISIKITIIDSTVHDPYESEIILWVND